MQVDALLEAFAKTNACNRAAAEHLTDTLKFMRQLGIPFQGQRDSGLLKPVSDVKT